MLNVKGLSGYLLFWLHSAISNTNMGSKASFVICALEGLGINSVFGKMDPRSLSVEPEGPWGTLFSVKIHVWLQLPLGILGIHETQFHHHTEGLEGHKLSSGLLK